ncbi:type IV pilin accessory protein [Acinetobacter sp. R933-2]|uniref:TfpX/TfpZ family type IV pilin accessory protein n=1 Tax=Acinetobacter sp. R933-2 TaxID=2746728 RepID=UPI0025779F45|nr:TfpX/TfpZ family type IV pilin accessory protein [Acinetobacter sp. R933-2]MDM1246090.1 type IV pilin accessory protein [Acinetobacter sp. R933-2]
MSKRLKFFLNHLSISLMLALCVVGLVFFIWYPTPLATAVGVTQIFLMMLAIDVIVGPVLGLLVYKEGKKSLKFDIAVIIALQVSALCYGIYSIEQGRPAWLVYYVDRFELVRKNDIILDHIDQAQQKFQHVSWTKPQLVAIKSAKDVQQHNNDMFIEVLGGISLSQQPERYVELTQAKTSIKQRAQPLALLNDFNDPNIVKMILAQYPQATAFLPLKATAVDMVVLVNKESASIIKIVDLRPWE